MKPSDAKKLLPGTVLALSGFRGPRRVVVQSVRVHSPQKVYVFAEDRYDAREYDARVLEVPTPGEEAAWAAQDAKAAALADYLKEKEHVASVLGGTVIDRESGYRSDAVTYFVQLPREQALALVRRLESVDDET